MLFDLALHPSLDELASYLKRGDSLLIEELWEGPKALLIAAALRATGKSVVVLTSGVSEERLHTDLPTFTHAPVVELPAWDSLPSEEIPPSRDIIGERYTALAQVAESAEPLVLLSSLQAAVQPVVPPELLVRSLLTVESGQPLPFDRFLQQLGEMGYQRAPLAADKGEYAVRGGIIDLYPVNSPDPFRVEFWGDEVDSIRLYDPVGQKSIHAVDRIRVAPAVEWEWLRDPSRCGMVADYFPKGALLFFDDLLHLEDRSLTLGRPGPLLYSFDQLLVRLQGWQAIYLSQSPIEELGEVHPVTGGLTAFSLFGMDFKARRWSHPFFAVAEVLPGEGLQAVAALASEGGLEVDYLYEGEVEEERLRSTVDLSKSRIHRGYLSSGFVLPKAKLAVVSMAELTHRTKIRRQKLRSTYHTAPAEFSELVPGQCVVHLHSGIGRFSGVERQKNHLGVESEFLALDYAEGGRLYVPLTQSHLVSRYIGAGEELPVVHKLGSSKWRQTRAATERAIRDYATELLELYAQRELIRGSAYPEDSEEVRNFEREFPYVETEDQLRAIAEMKRDMIRPRPMDRLICGDVGYGKTEVAMRGAFKAVVDGGKQVALLVPTTVLALQHYETFSERMKEWPIRVALLSRFSSAKEVRETIEGVASGEVDILVGTHRIVGKDVRFKDLGLVIIDEEHRFGVRTKEKLRAFKQSVDCLSLSATPIPRTLYMSIVGARDMSAISTPPQDRLPIQTILCERGDEVIRSAIERELAREGQIYFLHNRVESLARVADHLKRLVPSARIEIGHGQMDADAMDELFHRFKRGEIDLLVATTIIESGIDIPNANTILIDRADTFGMADLYQLRGRVGRWNRRAYCYFLVPQRRELSEEARQRLSALVEVGGYGGGMKVAMRDLEIRGAGNILGTRQSGHLSAIGFHLYCKLLKRTIQQLQGKLPATITDVKLEFPHDGRLPTSYIAEPKLRMEIYQRFGEALSLEEVDALFDEVRDRFGKPPEEVVWLYHLMRIRVRAALERVELLKWHKGKLVIERQSKLSSVQVREPKSPADLEAIVVKALL